MYMLLAAAALAAARLAERALFYYPIPHGPAMRRPKVSPGRM
jgi:hypothetical protein